MKPGKVRWIKCRAEGPGTEGAEDVVVFDAEAGIALAGLSGPVVILALAEWRLELWGEETLEALASAISAAYDEHARNG